MDYERLLQGILDIGEEMVTCGAEVSRVEDSILRMCQSYGAKRVNVFIITSNIQVTMEAPDGKIITQIRRMIRFSVNFDRLDYLNNLSRYVCKNNPDPDALQEKLQEVMDRPKPSKFLQFSGAVLVSAGFAVFFGGTCRDALAAAVMGAVIFVIELVLASREKNQIVYHFIASVIAGFAAILTVKLHIGQHPDLIMIGGIMLLIPGIAMTNSIRDMLIGDIASGLLRLCGALLVAASIACGFAFSIIILGGILL